MSAPVLCADLAERFLTLVRAHAGAKASQGLAPVVALATDRAKYQSEAKGLRCLEQIVSDFRLSSTEGKPELLKDLIKLVREIDGAARRAEGGR